MPINPAELIIREDGSIYHLNLRPEDICDTIITVGDPERVERVSQHLDEIYFKKQSREIVSHKGRIGKTDVLVISTGMGPDNVEIVMTELDALANINLHTREVRDGHHKLSVIRIGTSGSIHSDIKPGSLLASRTGTGLDSLMEFYPFSPGKEEAEFAAALRKHLGFYLQPYHANCSETLMARFGNGMYEGHTLTCPGFYAPQGRTLRIPPRNKELLEQLISFSHGDKALTNIEMETAAMYAFGQMMGHEMLSLNAIIADRRNGAFADDPHGVIDGLIEHVLERIEE